MERRILGSSYPLWASLRNIIFPLLEKSPDLPLTILELLVVYRQPDLVRQHPKERKDFSNEQSHHLRNRQSLLFVLISKLLLIFHIQELLIRR
eukprot:02678.XXX_98322_98600_1 [CDS] Oithona nana genome sequencing.